MTIQPVQVKLLEKNFPVTIQANQPINVLVKDKNPIEVTFPSVNLSVGFLKAADFRFLVAPLEAPDGIRTVFTLPNSLEYVSGTLCIFRNQSALTRLDFSETSPTTFTLNDPPDADEDIRLNFIIA